MSTAGKDSTLQLAMTFTLFLFHISSCIRDLCSLFFRVDLLRKEVNIALVGKYTKLEDSYASVLKALQHAAIDVGYKLNVSVSMSMVNLRC